jgi:hypothetical protein
MYSIYLSMKDTINQISSSVKKFIFRFFSGESPRLYSFSSVGGGGEYERKREEGKLKERGEGRREERGRGEERGGGEGGGTKGERGREGKGEVQRGGGYQKSLQSSSGVWPIQSKL